MANRNVSQVLGVHVRLADLDFIVTMEGELVRAPAAVQPLHSTCLNMIAEALEEL